MKNKVLFNKVLNYAKNGWLTVQKHYNSYYLVKIKIVVPETHVIVETSIPIKHDRCGPPVVQAD